MPARELAHRAAHALVVEAPVAHRALLRDGEHPMGGGDDSGSVRGDHPVLGGAARFKELGSDEEIHVARGGKQSHDRPPGAGVGTGAGALLGSSVGGVGTSAGVGADGGSPRLREVAAIAGQRGAAAVPVSVTATGTDVSGADLQVIGGGPGSLRDPGYRRRLHPAPVLRCRIHEPAREYPSALATEGRYHDRPSALGRKRRHADPGTGSGVESRASSGSGGDLWRGRRLGDQPVARAGNRIRIRLRHDCPGFRRERARRSPGSLRRRGFDPTRTGYSRPRPGRTRGKAPPRVRPRRTRRIPRSRC